MVTLLLGPDDPFPPTSLALGPDTEAPGLLAVGGELTPQRLRLAYAQGIFPWFSAEDLPAWWSTSPRMALMVADFQCRRSLRQRIKAFLRDPANEIRIDTAFADVIAACAAAPRPGQNGTWIGPSVRAAYQTWHQMGDVHSIETWSHGQLVGGLYGVGLGHMFFGESMFAHQTDASKLALAALVALCRAQGIAMIDCQQETRHLASLGARPLPREVFEARMHEAIRQTTPIQWHFDPAWWSLVI